MRGLRGRRRTTITPLRFPREPGKIAPLEGVPNYNLKKHPDEEAARQSILQTEDTKQSRRKLAQRGRRGNSSLRPVASAGGEGTHGKIGIGSERQNGLGGLPDHLAIPNSRRTPFESRRGRGQ